MFTSDLNGSSQDQKNLVGMAALGVVCRQRILVAGLFWAARRGFCHICRHMSVVRYCTRDACIGTHPKIVARCSTTGWRRHICFCESSQRHFYDHTDSISLSDGKPDRMEAFKMTVRSRYCSRLEQGDSSVVGMADIWSGMACCGSRRQT